MTNQISGSYWVKVTQVILVYFLFFGGLFKIFTEIGYAGVLDKLNFLQLCFEVGVPSS
jgi:hypothetical protein